MNLSHGNAPELHEFTTKHFKFTGSKIAEKILDNWDKEVIHFVKVMPKALKEVLATRDKKHLKAV